MRKVIGLIFVVVGIVFLMNPFYQNYKKQEKLDEVERSLSYISSGNEQAVPKKMRKNLEKAMRLEIPSIELKEPVLNKTTKETLNMALTQIKENQTPGQGNFTVAGHRSFKEGLHFNKLPEVKKGDEVLLLDKDKTYVYVIEKTKTVLPTQVDVLQDDKNEKSITLITCTPMKTATHRFVATGVLKEIK